MIAKIKQHPELSKLLRAECCENEVCVSISSDVDPESVVILKVDDFYNAQNIEFRPKSIDCLIFRSCKDGGYGIVLVELKNISSMGHYQVGDILGKFETTLFDFIEKRFKRELLHDFKEIKLYFVSNIEIYRRDMGLKMEAMMNMRIKFQGRRLMISPMMPTPTIKNCR
jgi:hypothetical protein